MGIAALIISFVALLVAGATALYNKRNAEAAEGARNAADRAANAAKDSAESARQVATAEMGRDHRELSPKEEWVRFDTKHNPRTGKEGLFAYLRPPRTYLTHADLIHDTGARSPVSFSPANEIDGGTEGWVYVGDLDNTIPNLLEIRFFPPVSPNASGPWTCPCGAPLIGDQPDPGHWVLKVPVDDSPLRPSLIV